MYRVASLGLLFFLVVFQAVAQTSTQQINAAPTGSVCDEAHEANADPCEGQLEVNQLEVNQPDAEPAAGIPAASGVESASSSLTTKIEELAKPESDAGRAEGIGIAVQRRQPGFQWGAAVGQSMKLLAFQQGMMLATDKWARYSLVHGKFFSAYAASVKGGLRQWDDGDPFIDNYIGHPLQGAVTGYIQVQNDPAGRNVVFGGNRAYWKSRLKAMGWIAAYSTQFEIGPISEASIEKLGGFEYRNCDGCRMVQGAGWVDLVVTPTLGTAWMIGEDALDRYVVQRIEGRLGRGKWANLFRSVLNPARVGANALRMKAPWYRDRDHADAR
jgi:hypothetical protein